MCFLYDKVQLATQACYSRWCYGHFFNYTRASWWLETAAQPAAYEVQVDENVNAKLDVKGHLVLLPWYQSADAVMMWWAPMFCAANSCMPRKYFNPVLMTFGTKNILPRETLSAAEPNMPGPVWGENIPACLAGCTEFQYIVRIPSSLRNRAFFKHWPSNHFVPFQPIFSHWLPLHRHSSHRKYIKETDRLKQKLLSFKPALFHDKKDCFAVSGQKNCSFKAVKPHIFSFFLNIYCSAFLLQGVS